MRLYGFDKLTRADKKKTVLLCEGPLDAIALDYNIGSNNRQHYVIVASPGGFRDKWAEHFKGRKVRALYDNDDAGRKNAEKVGKVLILGREQFAKEVCVFRWPEEYPDGYDINDLVRDGGPGFKVVGFTSEHSYKVVSEPKLVIHHGRRPKMKERPIDWIWPNHLRCGTYASFSGEQGTFKSTIALELVARYTTGRGMPTMKGKELAWELPGMPAGDVLYVYAEDDRERVENGFEYAGGDFARWHSMPAVNRDGDGLNILDHLGEIEQTIREYGIRLVVIDGQNSVVGAPNISTDMLARHHITNKLHQFAQRLNICLLGIRNEDKEGRAYGPASMADLGRCVMRAKEIKLDPNSTPDPPFCKLVFVKVSDTARSKYPPIPYSVKDCGGSRREIEWGKRNPGRAGANRPGAEGDTEGAEQ